MEFEEVGSFESAQDQDGGKDIFDFLNTSQSINEYAGDFISEMQVGEQPFSLGFDLLPPLNPLGDSVPFAPVTSDQGLPSPHSEFLESLSSSPMLSPSPGSAASPYSAESGIEDDTEMEEYSPIDLFNPKLPTDPVMTSLADPVTSLSAMPVVSGPSPVQVLSSPSSPRSRSSTSSRRGRSKMSSQEASTTATLASVQQELQNLISSVSTSSQPVLKTEAVPYADTSVVNSVCSLIPSSCPVSVNTCTNQGSLLMQNIVPASTVSTTTVTTQSVTADMEESMVSSVQDGCVGRSSETPKLVIVEEPEENYRARYESEGCRGPIHGTTDNTFPTIKVDGYTGQVWISVHLVTSGGQAHYHSIHGPGSTKVPCKEMTLQGGIPAVQVMVAPDSNMTAILDSLSIRRLRNWEGDRELKKRGIDPRTWKKERKEACLMFQAEIPGTDNQTVVKLTCLSRIFQCSTSGPAGNPEVWWASLTEGSVEGGDELGLIGKKFQTGFRVRFSADLPSGKSTVSFDSVYNFVVNAVLTKKWQRQCEIEKLEVRSGHFGYFNQHNAGSTFCFNRDSVKKNI